MKREELVDFILSFMPLMHKKLFLQIQVAQITRQQLGLLRTIGEENGKSMKHYSQKLMIAKSNLSNLANQLINEKLVERKTDEKDRRIMNLFITNKGYEILQNQMKLVKKNMLKKIEVLSDEEISIVSKSLKEIKTILGKIEA